jgi:hypothetical protein
MLKSKARGLLRRRRRPLWIISCYQNNRIEVLTINPNGSGGGCYVPIFSFEEEAQTFLCLLEDDEKKKMEWSIRQTAPGELISVLYAPCAHARGVAIDPLPPLPFCKAMPPLVRVKRELFVRYLMEERKECSGEVVAA